MPDGPSEIFVFDALGTLFDLRSAVRRHTGAIGIDAARLSEIWRAKQLEYTWFHAARGTHVPFRNLTRDSLIYALDLLKVSHDHAPQLLEGYQSLEAFPEVAECLTSL